MNQFQILLFLKWFEKIQLIFINHEFNKEKTEIDKWNMNFNNLMNYKYEHDLWINNILILIRTNQHQHKNIMLIKYEIQNNWLFYYNNFIISNFKFLQFKIFEFAYNVVIAEHSNHVKIYEIAQQFYYWFMMHDFVRKYVQFCSICTWEKTWHTKKQDVLKFLSVFMW